MNLNYTCICWYCGQIYKSNRSTSKYCSSQHNSLYAVNGSQIDYTVLNSQGEYVSYHQRLQNLYLDLGNTQSWSIPYSYNEIVYRYHYTGPLPKADELLFVSGYLIRKLFLIDEDYYFFMPLEKLTKQEKASGKIIDVEFYYLKEDY